MSEKCTVCKGIGKVGEPPVTCFFCRGEKTVNITEIMDRGQCKAEKLELLERVNTIACELGVYDIVNDLGDIVSDFGLKYEDLEEAIDKIRQELEGGE